MSYVRERETRESLDTDGRRAHISETPKYSRNSGEHFEFRFETDVKFDIDVSMTSRPRKPL